jgi:hypothetical protein
MILLSQFDRLFAGRRLDRLAVSSRIEEDQELRKIVARMAKESLQ